MKKTIILFLLWAFCPSIHAADVILSTGISTANLGQFLGEAGNRSGSYSLRLAGKSMGLRIDKSVHGDDAGNTYITGDLLARPLPYLVLGGGMMYATQPLRGRGQQVNFHGMIGLEHDKLFGRYGGGAWFDHFSNGHFHRLTGWDGVPNPPRNALSIGVIIPF